MINILKYKKTILIIGLLFVELISFLSFLNPSINNLVFLIVFLSVLFAAFYRLEYAVYILFAELIIGSKGYLFSIHFNDVTISIRMAIWLIIMSVWFIGYLGSFVKDKTWPKLSIPNFKLFITLFAFILLGIANGLWHHNGYSNIFFDSNGWFFFLLIFPLSQIIISDFFEKLKTVFISSTIWLSIKTFLILYFFSHNFFILPVVYKWIRDTGVGEITFIQSGFYRIFIQSHIFVLIAFIIVSAMILLSIIKNRLDKKEFFNKIFISSFFLSVILISFSRSFWVGLSASFLIIYSFIFYYFKPTLKSLMMSFFVFIAIVIIAISLVTITVRFPYPRAIGNFNTASLLTDRANDLTGEAGVSSRWALLPVLSNKIFKSPILGYGFGSTVTYRSSDPRILFQNLDGLYTTYAFEWGWLDTWLKVGFLGMAIYLYIIFYFIFKTANDIKRGKFVDKNYITTGILAALASIAILNNFSPYLNHPLGILFILILNKYLFNNNKITA